MEAYLELADALLSGMGFDFETRTFVQPDQGLREDYEEYVAELQEVGL